MHWRTVPAGIEPTQTATAEVNAKVLKAQRELAAEAQRLGFPAGPRSRIAERQGRAGQGAGDATAHASSLLRRSAWRAVAGWGAQLLPHGLSAPRRLVPYSSPL